MKLRKIIFTALAILAVHTTSVLAQMTINVDEAGTFLLNGAPGPNGILGIEPVSGMQCLVFGLNFQPNPGDIEMVDTNNVAGDLIRFIPNSGKLYLFSLDDEPTSDALADVPALAPPNAALNRISFQEQGIEGNDFLSYLANPGQIGADGANPVQYTFHSDGVVPEPSTFILLGLGVASVGLVAFNGRKGTV